MIWNFVKLTYSPFKDATGIAPDSLVETTFRGEKQEEAEAAAALHRSMEGLEQAVVVGVVQGNEDKKSMMARMRSEIQEMKRNLGLLPSGDSRDKVVSQL